MTKPSIRNTWRSLMALSLATLQASMTALPLQTSGNTAAGAFAQTYAAYASRAQDAGGNFLVTGSQEAFRAQLAQAFATPNGTPQSAAAAFASAFSAYWSGAVFATPGAGAKGASVGGDAVMSATTSSAVSSAQPTSLQATLLQIFLTNDANTLRRLSALAQALDSATRQNVIVLMTGLDTTPPPTGPLPTSQVGLVS